jgi:hypothetical protein
VKTAILTSSFLLAAPAAAAPPPPPSPAALLVAKGFALSLTNKDASAYANLLDDDVIVTSAGKQVASTKAAWMTEIAREFSNSAFRPRVTDIFEGYTEAGDQLMFVEQIGFFVYGNSRSPDCCTYHRVEVLTLKDGKIARINQTPSLDGRLSPTGERIDDG